MGSMFQNTKKHAFAAPISCLQNNTNIDCTICASDVSKTRENNAFSAAMACFRNGFSLFRPRAFTYDTQIKEQCKCRLQKMCNRWLQNAKEERSCRCYGVPSETFISLFRPNAFKEAAPKSSVTGGVNTFPNKKGLVRCMTMIQSAGYI